MTLSELGNLLSGNKARKCPGRRVYQNSCIGRMWGLTSEIPCPVRGRLVLRMRKSDKELFWGCSGFPDCTATRNFHEGDLK